MPPSRAAALPSAPATWPFDRLEIGFADAPGGAANLRADAPFGLRYQYLAGGVNTGNGWATWNTNGDFVKWYVQDSVANGMVAVFPYYQMLQSSPATGGGESAKDLNNLKNASTMAAYWADVRLFMQKAAAGASGHPVVLHVEPDLWGYIEQGATDNDAKNVPASVASSGDADLAGLPNTAVGFAKAFVKLRDLYAPNVLLAYHASVWGTMFDLHASQTSDAQTDQLAAKAAAFYGSLNADFDLVFTDLADRDAGFYQHQYGDGGAAWWNASDFPRYGRFIGGLSAGTGKRVVVWQIPMGNTLMRATNDTWGHYADNRPEWFLDDVSDGRPRLVAGLGRRRAAVRRRRGRDDLRLRRRGRWRDEPRTIGDAHARRRCRPTTTVATCGTGSARTTTPAGCRSSPATTRRPRRPTTRPAATRRRHRPSRSPRARRPSRTSSIGATTRRSRPTSEPRARRASCSTSRSTARAATG